jgi:hypothetical protein
VRHMLHSTNERIRYQHPVAVAWQETTNSSELNSLNLVLYLCSDIKLGCSRALLLVHSTFPRWKWWKNKSWSLKCDRGHD